MQTKVNLTLSNNFCNCGDLPCEKNTDPSRPAFQGQSRSLEPTRSATYDFLVVYRRNYSPNSYRFRDKWRKSAKFSHSLVFNAPLRGFPLEFCNGGRAQKTWMMPLPECLKVWRYVYLFWHSTSIGQRRTDGRTDRQTDKIGKTISHSACIACWRAITVIRSSLITNNIILITFASSDK